MRRHQLLILLLAIPMLHLSCSDSRKQGESVQTITAVAGIFTKKQSEQGAVIYKQSCAACHGNDLRGTEGGSMLVGDRFIAKWKDQTMGKLFEVTKATMPKNNPHSLDDKAYASLVAFILDANVFPSGDHDLSYDQSILAKIVIGTPLATRRSAGFIPRKYDGKVPTIESEWLQHRGDYASTNYSKLDQINRENVKSLTIAWRWKTDNFGASPEFYFKSTPLMAKGVLYTTAGSSRTVAAIHGETGETLWTFRYDEKERKASVPRQNSGRGVAYWASPEKGKDRIIYVTPGYTLIALDAQTGQLIAEFGDHGKVDLKKSMDQPMDLLTATIGSTSPPIVVNDVIVVGASFPVGLAPVSKKQVRGDIMGFDAKTGKQLWIFHTIPQAGEVGNETWEKESWKYTGNTAAWAPLTADPQLGYVYLPIEAPTGDFYGGHRPGNNLFSQSLVCLNARTGKRVWHYQLIHHDIWDYDLPAPPVLADIIVDGKKIKAVVQVTKQAFAYVFDRETGKPVWPIEERAVPQSEVKGEWASPTQPFPTKPAAFDRQGYSEDILVDFTPAIKKEALEIVSKYKKGPMYTPVSKYAPPTSLGTLMIPDAVGAPIGKGVCWIRRQGCCMLVPVRF